MKIARVLAIAALLFAFTYPPRDGKYYLEKTVTSGMTENKPYFVKGRELARVVMDGLRSGKISSFRYILGRLDQPRMIQRESVVKRLLVKKDLFSDLDDEETDENTEAPEYYTPDQMHFRILEEVQVTDNKISTAEPLWLDIFVSGRHKIDGIDHYVGSFRFKDCKELFAADERSQWINPSNHSQTLNFSRALELGIYRAEVLSAMNDNADEVFFSTVDFGGDDLKGAEPFVQNIFKSMKNGGLETSALEGSESYISYRVERLINLDDAENKSLFGEDQNIVVALYEAGAAGVIPLHHKRQDGTWTTLDLNTFTGKFTTERGLDSVNIPIKNLDQLLIVEDLKVENGEKKYSTLYLGLLVPEDLTYSGYPVNLGYLKFEECKKILEDLKTDQQTVFEFIQNRKFAGTKTVEVTTIFGDKALFSADSEDEVDGFSADEVKMFKSEIGN